MDFVHWFAFFFFFPENLSLHDQKFCQSISWEMTFKILVLSEYIFSLAKYFIGYENIIEVFCDFLFVMYSVVSNSER